MSLVLLIYEVVPYERRAFNDLRGDQYMDARHNMRTERHHLTIWHRYCMHYQIKWHEDDDV